MANDTKRPDPYAAVTAGYEGEMGPRKGAATKTSRRPWQGEKDPVKALHHVVQHLATTYGGGGGTKPKQITHAVALDLASALQPLVGPYQNQLTSALNSAAATAGPGASKQAQQAAMGSPDLGQYLGQITQGLSANPGLAGAVPGGAQGLEGVLTSGLANVGKANEELPGAIGQQVAGVGPAGLLGDLLNAARYQTIYKQGLYGPAPSASVDPALAQLFQAVQAGGASVYGPGTLSGLKAPGSTPGTPGGTGAGGSGGAGSAFG